MARIELKGLTHTYETASPESAVYAVRRLDHLWPDGGAYALLGPSGCGKTTLLNIIAGLIRQSGGTLLIDGEDTAARLPDQRPIVQLCRHPVSGDTVFDGLARSDAAAILLDDPLRTLDPQQKEAALQRLKQIHQQTKATMIYATPDQKEALGFADQVTVMQDGRLLQTGSPAQLMAAPSHSFVGAFTGSPGMNILPCLLKGDSAMVENVPIPLAPEMADRARQTYSRLDLGIRPEYLKFDAAMSPGAIQVNIHDIAESVSGTLVTASIGSLPVMIRVAEGGLVPGRQGWLTFPPGHIIIFAAGEAV